MNLVDHCPYGVRWSAEGGEYLGTVAELPSLSWLGSDRAEAFSGIQQLAAEVVADTPLTHLAPHPHAQSSPQPLSTPQRCPSEHRHSQVAHTRCKWGSANIVATKCRVRDQSPTTRLRLIPCSGRSCCGVARATQ
jgi:predicted RNase H-like HicB family nuclease